MKKRVLVVTSYRIPCGIAQYAEHLVPHLQDLLAQDFDIEVAPLDVTVLRAESRTGKRLAGRLIADIASKARAADVVLLQLEPGLLGFSPFSIRRRLRRILRAARKVVITHHTVLNLKETYLRFPSSFSELVLMAKAFRRTSVLRWLYRTCRARPQKFFHILQTRTDARTFALLGIPEERVASHPLAFLGDDQVARLARKRGSRRSELLGGRSDVHLTGVFGFLTEYKGIEVAVRALDALPEHHHLLIAGGLHPEGIEPHTTRQPYLDQLTELIAPSKSRKARRRKGDPSTSKHSRVHFVGRVDNDAFAEYMQDCDAVVLPYAEVGQKSSGPASIALDLGQRILCSRNVCFSELDRYEPGAVELFEIGNHLELAQHLARPDTNAERRAAFHQRYDIRSRTGVYRDAIERLLTGSDRSVARG